MKHKYPVVPVPVHKTLPYFPGIIPLSHKLQIMISANFSQPPCAVERVEQFKQVLPGLADSKQGKLVQILNIAIEYQIISVRQVPVFKHILDQMTVYGQIVPASAVSHVQIA